MPVHIKAGGAVQSTTELSGRMAAVAAAALMLAFGAPSGAWAQCAGAYDAGLDPGAHGLASANAGIHPATSAAHASESSSSCSMRGATAGGAGWVHLRSAADLDDGKAGVVAGAHRAAPRAANVSEPGALRKLGKNEIRLAGLENVGRSAVCPGPRGWAVLLGVRSWRGCTLARTGCAT